MTTTRLFKNGNSQAVRIPAELAFPTSDMELVIERVGEEHR
jgi:antitoxin VapB